MGPASGYMALVETCLASNKGCARGTKVAHEVPGVCMKAQGCTRSARGVCKGTERMSIVARDEGKSGEVGKLQGSRFNGCPRSHRGSCAFEVWVEASQTREKADEFGVHRLQNDLHEMPGVPK